MAKFNVGDRVKIMSNGDTYYTSEMTTLIGEDAIIMEVLDKGTYSKDVYLIDIDNKYWIWGDASFSPIKKYNIFGRRIWHTTK